MSQFDPDAPSLRKPAAKGGDKEQHVRKKERPRTEFPTLEAPQNSGELEAGTRNKDGNDSLLAQKQKTRGQKVTDLVESDDTHLNPLPQISKKGVDGDSAISKREVPKLAKGESFLKKTPDLPVRSKIQPKIVINDDENDDEVSRKKKGLADILSKPSTADGLTLRTKRAEKTTLAEPVLETQRRHSNIPRREDEDSILDEIINRSSTRKQAASGGVGRMTTKALKALGNREETSGRQESAITSKKTVRATPVKPAAADKQKELLLIEKSSGKARSPGAFLEGKMYPKWRIVLAYAKIAVKLIKSYSIHFQSMQKILGLPLNNIGQMAFIMQMFKTTPDPAFSKKLTHFLDPSINRNREIINTLDQLLKYRLKSYSMFSLDRRMKLCKVMQMNVMNAGESVGRIQLINDIRMASVATLAPTEFLIIDKREFSDMSQLLTKEELDDQLDSLSRLPHFTKHKEFLLKTNSLFEVLVYSMGDVILTEGQTESKIYFILEGNCKCAKKVPFIQKKGSAGKDMGIYEQNMTVGPNEEIIEHTFTIQELETSDHFPGINPETKKLNQVDIERAAMTSETDFDTTILEFSVAASSRIEVACIARSDYMRFATPDMLVETIQQKNLYDVSVRQVQEGYLQKLKWDSFKKNTKLNKDGEAAGQSVPHVHIHLIPRHKGDWMDNDEIYPEIDRKEAELGTAISKDSGQKPLKKIVPDALRAARSFEDMGKEADLLRPLFEQFEDIWR
ncbi:hypothetical protein HDV01_000986 [Terramyces sp. JEL0728]|nr:hypothetical protein HDV01_000986 [Terramyces sp. JEL0728]